MFLGQKMLPTTHQCAECPFPQILWVVCRFMADRGGFPALGIFCVSKQETKQTKTEELEMIRLNRNGTVPSFLTFTLGPNRQELTVVGHQQLTRTGFAPAAISVWPAESGKTGPLCLTICCKILMALHIVGMSWQTGICSLACHAGTDGAMNLS